MAVSPECHVLLVEQVRRVPAQLRSFARILAQDTWEESSPYIYIYIYIYIFFFKLFINLFIYLSMCIYIYIHIDTYTYIDIPGISRHVHVPYKLKV